MGEVIQFLTNESERPKLWDLYRCVKLVRDGEGPTMDQSGASGYPEFRPGDVVQIVEIDDTLYWSITVLLVSTISGRKLSTLYNEAKLNKYFVKDTKYKVKKNLRCAECDRMGTIDNFHIVTKSASFCSHKCILDFMEKNPDLF